MALFAAVVQPCVQNHMMSCLASTLYAVLFILAHFVHVLVLHSPSRLKGYFVLTTTTVGGCTCIFDSYRVSKISGTCGVISKH